MKSLTIALLLAEVTKTAVTLAADGFPGTADQNFLPFRTKTAFLNFMALTTIGLAIGAVVIGVDTLAGLFLVVGAYVCLAGIFTALSVDCLGREWPGLLSK